MLDLILFCLPQILIIPLAFFWSCYPCCGGCEIYTDAFGDTDEAGFTQTSGTWTESGGYMATASSSAKLTCDTTHPDAVPSHYVSVSMYGATSDELIVHVGTNHKATVTIGSPNGCLALYDGATLLTKMLIDAPATTAKTLKVWYGLTPVADGADSQFAAQWDNGTILRYNVTRAGNGVALGTGTVASTVRFDDFVWERHYTTTDTSCKKPDAPTCTIVTDAFTRADDTNIGCGLTETAGAWSISANDLVTSSSSAKATIETTHPQGVTSYSLAVTFQSSAADDVLKFYTSIEDDNYAQIIIGTAKTAKLFVGGVEKISVALTTAINTNYSIVLTQSLNGLSLDGAGLTGCLGAASPLPAGPVHAGLGTGTMSGTATFGTYTLYRAYDSNNTSCEKTCTECTSQCSAGTTPVGFEADFGGVTAGTCGVAADCTDINNTIYEVTTPFGVSIGVFCTWLFNDTTPRCGGGSGIIDISISLAGAQFLDARLLEVWLQTGRTTYEDEAAFLDTPPTAPYDCADEYSGWVAVPQDATTIDGAFGFMIHDGVCDTTAMTCSIRAI